MFAFQSKDGIASLLTLDAIKHPRAFFERLPLQLREFSQELGITRIRQYHRLPGRLVHLKPVELEALRRTVLDAVVPATQNFLNDKQIDALAAHALAAAEAHFHEHPQRRRLGQAAYWTAWFIGSISIWVRHAEESAETSLREQFVLPCAGEAAEAARTGAAYHGIHISLGWEDEGWARIGRDPLRAATVALSSQLASAARPADVMHLAVGGDAEVLHDAIRWLATIALRWRWVTTVIEAWRRRAATALASKERKDAKKHLKSIGADLSEALLWRGRPKNPPKTPQRRRTQVTQLTTLLRQAKSALKDDAPDEAEAMLRKRLNGLELDQVRARLEEGYPSKQIALQVVKTREEARLNAILTPTGIDRSIRRKKRRKSTSQ